MWQNFTRIWSGIAGFAVIFQFTACLQAFGQTKFTEITEEAGIQHVFKVFEGLFGGGVCVLDVNNDGFQDLFLTSGMYDDILYLNLGNGSFKNVYSGSGLEVTKHYVTQGAVAADVNRDGWVDLFITTITSKDSVKVIPREKNLLFLNNGDFTFRDVTTEFGLDRMNSFSTGANFGDFNADGYPDLYVGNYFLEYEGELDTIYDATIVNANKTAKGYLLQNKNGKKLVDVYAQYGMSHRGFGFGGVFTDFDNDSDPDLMVMHDFGYKATPNFLYENKYPYKSFKDISEAKNLNLKINSMGTAVGDFNGDGWLDYFMTNIRYNYMMVNQGKDQPLLDQAKELKLVYYTISWGANFADFDNDGDVDLFVSNGDLNPNCVPMVNQYFENEAGQFTEKAHVVGLNDYGMGRGSAFFDLENDGDLDLIVVNQEPILSFPENIKSVTKLYRNDSATGNWIEIALKGIQAETHGIGSRIEVVAGGRKMIREVDGGSGHLAQNSTVVHFGVGSHAVIDTIRVIWLGGKEQILTHQNANQFLTITEIEGKTSNWMYWPVGLLAILGAGWFLFFRLRKS